MAEYKFKNGQSVTIRGPKIEDAEAMINLIKTADTESTFLAREEGEFKTSVEREREILTNVINDKSGSWFMAELEGKVVGQCNVGFIRRNLRYRHRAEVSFVILREFCHLGIGGKMMEQCLKWCKDKNIEQVELDVVTINESALNMYRSFGFEITGTLPRALKYEDGTYADEYYMVKNCCTEIING